MSDPERPSHGDPLVPDRPEIIDPLVVHVDEQRLLELGDDAFRDAVRADRVRYGVSGTGAIGYDDDMAHDDLDDDDDMEHDLDEHDVMADNGVLGRSARAFFEWTLVVAIAIVVAVVVRTFLLAHFVVDGTSMASTLASGDRVFVNKMSYRLQDPSRGDVIVLHQISGTSERDLIKRVIALPGETIEIRSCEVLITDPEGTTRRLIEPYLDESVVTPGNCGGDYRAIDGTVVPDDHVFVLGDNRSGSQDSRALGAVAYDDIVGRAFVVFWPRDSWQWL